MSVFVLQGDGKTPSRRIDYAAELNQEQLDVVLHGDGPCLVLAGAGSGKTRTVTYRVSYLLEQGVDPSQILLLTFTNKASKEMLGRVSGLLGGGSLGIWGGTFHSIGNRILRMNADIVGHTSSFTILDQEDAQSLVKAVMKGLHIDPKARRFPTANVVHNIISYARNTLKPLSDVIEAKHPNFIEFVAEIEDIGRLYRDRKKASNAMDFDDLLVNFLNVLNHPVAGDRLTKQFKYVLVDEYQDTNALQALIVQALAKEHGNVLVVGDDAQSIYAFRGADVKNILGFPGRWPDTRIFKLLTNYRSVPEILDLANESLSHNRAQFQKDLHAVKPRGTKPVIVPAASAKQEAQFIAEQLLLLRAEGVALANMAVLFRSSAHSQSLEFELMKRDIPYEYRGGMKFFERAHIKDVLSHVRVAANASDEAAWLRVLHLQSGIGATTAASIMAKLRGNDDLAQAIAAVSAGLPSRATVGWKEFSKIAERILVQAPHPGRMIRAVLDGGYRDYLEREYPDYRDRSEDLDQLATFADNYAVADAFLSDIALYDETVTGRNKDDGGKEERLVLSTIHQAKGLEWDTVCIIHLADQSFPSKRSLSEDDGLEEERRLFYVAVTRARRKLFLTYPQTGGGYDTFSLNSPSAFLEEVPPRLFERIELREAPNMRPTMTRGSMATGTVWKKGDTTDADRADWSWDNDGPTVELDENGDRKNATPTVWKSSIGKKLPPMSFLSDISDL